MIGRDAQLAVLTRMAARARGGDAGADAAGADAAGAVVVRGPAGIGKSTLLDALAAASPGSRVLRVTGLEAEAELPFAALHLLLRPARPLVDALPDAQRTALLAALGHDPVDAQDRFLVGLAVLTLLSDLAGERPLLCLVDDAQWLDRASADALVFAARRLDHDPVTMVFAARDEGGGLAVDALPGLRLSTLSPAESAVLVSAVAPGLAPEARERVIAEAQGNPLALVEFAGALTDRQRAGHLLAVPQQPLPVTGRVEESFKAAIRALPERTRRLLLLAATEGTGDLGLVLRAAGDLGLADLAAAEHRRLVHIGDDGLAFRHPLVRTAAYRHADHAQRIAAHRALAGVLGAAEHADRRAWHLSAAAVGPDEETGDALAAVGDRGRLRGSHASAVTAYERAAQLTVDRELRARRLVDAAETAIRAGLWHRASAAAERGLRVTKDPAVRARFAAVRATVDSADGGAAPSARSLIDAAAGIAESAPTDAAAMLSTAAGNAWSAGDDAALRDALGLLRKVRPYADAWMAPVADAVAGMDRLAAGDVAEGLALMRRAIPDDRRAVPNQVVGTYAAFSALMTGDLDAARELASAWVDRCRRGGLVGTLAHALQLLAQARVLDGAHDAASSAAAEAWRIAADTGQTARISAIPGVQAWLAAVEGDEARCLDLAARADVAVGGVDGGSGWATGALGLLDLLHGRHRALAERIEAAPAHHFGRRALRTYTVADYVEACARLGEPERAATAAARFSDWAEASGRPWAKALAHRCRALLGPVEEAEAGYADALALHEEGGRGFERARTLLLYGEWLRRARRRADARTVLRTAMDAFAAVGAAPWAERARTELAAAGAERLDGGRPPASGPAGWDALTAQERHVVRLAATGATNRQIGAQLFLSPRTVGFHLYKAYPKLGVASRTELAGLVDGGG